MTTTASLATKALRRAKIVASNQDPSAADQAYAEDALTDLFASFEAEGYSGDSTPFDGRFDQAIVAMLAVKMAEDFGVAIGPVLASEAKRGEQVLQAAFFAVPIATSELAYVHRDVASEDVFGSVNASPSFNDWRENTAYTLRMYAVNNANLYEVVTAGTSGDTGPTGTGSSITDGTVTWCWRRVMDR